MPISGRQISQIFYDRQMTQFSNYLFQLRRSRQLLQKQLAYDSALDPSYLASLERGRRDPPRADVLDRILSALNATGIERKKLKNAAAMAGLIGAIKDFEAAFEGIETLIHVAEAIPTLSKQELAALETLVAGLLKGNRAPMEENIM
jgi:transcriptional regulator with XRE-family HTH domain